MCCVLLGHCVLGASDSPRASQVPFRHSLFPSSCWVGWEGCGEGGGGCLRQEQGFVLELTFPPFPECGLSATQAGSPDTLNGALCLRGTAEGSLRERVCEHALSTDPHLETAPCLALEINTAVAKEVDV